jgi:2,4-dienoyl-CoA reductase-like NADH-dependent reductase (Old Yellow Enzyme family)
MVPWRATDDGYVTQDVIDWYARLARGRPGAIVVEATGIRDIPSGPLLRIGHDRYIPGLKRLVEAVKLASGGRTKLLIQIIDFLAIRRRPEPRKYFERFLRITPEHRRAVEGENLTEPEVRTRLSALDEAEWERVLSPRELDSLRQGHRERVTDIDLPHISELPRALPPLFAAAAQRAEEAGFAGVELHYAHAYTMASFLSRTNDRRDGYGGDLAGRLRLPLEVYCATRAAVGAGFWSVAVFSRRSAYPAEAKLTTLLALAWRSHKPAWTFCRRREAANSTTRRGRPWTRSPILTLGAAATSACRNSFRTRAGRLAAMPCRQRRSATRSALPDLRLRSFARAASTILRWRRAGSWTMCATSSARRVNPSLTLTGR